MFHSLLPSLTAAARKRSILFHNALAARDSVRDPRRSVTGNTQR